VSSIISQIYGPSDAVFVGFWMLVAVLVLLFVRCLLISTPIAVRIFGRARLADMEKTWSVFSSGRSAMNEVRFGRASTLYSPPPAASVRGSPVWSVRLGETLSDFLIHVYAEQEETDSLNLRLNDVICGATMADVIDASIQCQRRRGGSGGDLLRDFAAVCRLIRAVGHKLKRIGALAHPLRAEKDEDVVMGAHTLTGVEELLENCFQALENYTGQSAVLGSVVWLPARSAEGSVHPFHRSCAFSFLGLEILWETVSKFCIT